MAKPHLSKYKNRKKLDPQHTAKRIPPSGKASGMLYTSSVPGVAEEPLMAHLFELRNRLAIVIIWLFLGLIIAYPFSAKGMLIIWKEFINPNLEMTAY